LLHFLLLRTKTANFLFFFVLVLFFIQDCKANSLQINGYVPLTDIKRSVAENWVAILTSNLKANLTEPGNYKIAIGVNSLDPSAWQGRYLRVQLENQADWLAISNLAYFHQVELVKNGLLLPTSDILAGNLNTGLHPFIPLKYESWANKNAVPGTSQLTVTLTILSEF
jgi:hypothetical protein